MRLKFNASVGVAAAMICAAQSSRWSESAAEAWYAKQSWLVGANYIPSNASNELEMWQADTFDPERIDVELGWAESLGMNTMRVFLHDLLWQQDADGFRRRIDRFLAIASKHHIRPILVLFDSCWDPDPKLGPQQAPRPGVHNSRWVQSPGAVALPDRAQYPRLEAYAKGVVGAFANDPRVLAWDVWNEPWQLTTSGPYRKLEAAHKRDLVRALLPQAFEWARAANPTQPLTSGITRDPGSTSLSAREKIQIDSSDIISFHYYDEPRGFRKVAEWLVAKHRPVLCTEYMARPFHSTFEGILPIAKDLHIAAYNWGLVNGKTQTNFPWDSWKKAYIDHQPPMWFHDIFYPDGRPYSEREVGFIRKLAQSGAPATQNR